MRMTLVPAVILLLLGPATAQTLKPYKDDLFAYPVTLDERDSGAFRSVDYREARDINERDEVLERRVNAKYVKLAVRSAQKDIVVETAAGPVRHFAVGAAKGAKIITVYLHGKGGSRRQGVDDFTFGGNFNRIKNLMWENGGLYLSPDFSDFGPAGVTQVSALLSAYLAASPAAKVIVACGSMGGAICWGIADDAQIASRLGGLMLLGSYPSKDFATSLAAKRKVPLFIGQGSRDTVFPIEGAEGQYRSLKQIGYPVRMVRFETGTHGTPIRMTDWRETLNWMMGR